MQRGLIIDTCNISLPTAYYTHTNTHTHIVTHTHTCIVTHTDPNTRQPGH